MPLAKINKIDPWPGAKWGRIDWSMDQYIDLGQWLNNILDQWLMPFYHFSLTLSYIIYRMWHYNVNIPFCFHSYLWNDANALRTVRLRTASEQLQNGMTSWATEWLDMGKMTCTFIELWNEHRQTCVAIEFGRWIVWNVEFFYRPIGWWEHTIFHHCKKGHSVRSI